MENAKFIEVLRDCRIEGDKILRELKLEEPNAHRGGYLREVKLSITSLQKGRMYLGEVQHDYGAKYPYEGTNEASTIEGIAMAADLYKPLASSLKGNSIENLGDVRKRLDRLVEDIFDCVFVGEGVNGIKDNPQVLDTVRKTFIKDCNFSEAYRSLKEARMWLGCAMGVIKDNN